MNNQFQAIAEKVNQDAFKFLESLRKRAAKDGIRATEAVRLMIEKFPGITRVEAAHTAVAAGIHISVVKNVYPAKSEA